MAAWPSRGGSTMTAVPGPRSELDRELGGSRRATLDSARPQIGEIGGSGLLGSSGDCRLMADRSHHSAMHARFDAPEVPQHRQGIQHSFPESEQPDEQVAVQLRSQSIPVGFVGREESP